MLEPLPEQHQTEIQPQGHQNPINPKSGGQSAAYGSVSPRPFKKNRACEEGKLCS
jgi:hypothetical protein